MQDFSMCYDCYKAGLWRQHPHTLSRVPIRGKAASEAGGDSDMLRHKEMLRRHLELLVHSCTCTKHDCVPNCIKMRDLLKHVHECPIRTQGGCKKLPRTKMRPNP
ncbi:histone acetyltransferase hac12 [Nannochloropsis gaditana]|uniref:histone acetyltransferase n=1 Tax=Nannochloropsis gaditana TaxID=72520 RepID=W7TTP3_9STRA|nr:histone acetyltransferase hac12 [Nannochloropsis gaditana]